MLQLTEKLQVCLVGWGHLLLFLSVYNFSGLDALRVGRLCTGIDAFCIVTAREEEVASDNFTDFWCFGPHSSRCVCVTRSQAVVIALSCKAISRRSPDEVGLQVLDL